MAVTLEDLKSLLRLNKFREAGIRKQDTHIVKIIDSIPFQKQQLIQK